MFHLKFLLLMTIASKACLAEEDWKDVFLRGECERFNIIIYNHDHWNLNRGQLPKAIEENYAGDLTMADNMHKCMSKYKYGDAWPNTLDKVKSYLALSRALRANSQQTSEVSLKVAMRMSEINSTLNTTFQVRERNVLEGLMDQFKNETSPSFKAVCFDPWVYIISPFDDMRLGQVSSASGLRMWPLANFSNSDNENMFKWYVTERIFRVNENQEPVVDVIFTNVVQSERLVSYTRNGVFASNNNVYYQWWTVEIWKGDVAKGIHKDIALFYLSSKESGKYFGIAPHYNDSSYKVTLATPRLDSARKGASYITILSKKIELQDWEGFIVRGECDNFQEAIENHGYWNMIKWMMPRAIQWNYAGDLWMAEDMYRCVSSYDWGQLFDNTLDNLKNYVALNRALKAYSQRNSDVALKVAMRVSEINATLNATFPLNERKVLEEYLDMFKEEILPSIKSICFDHWVRIICNDINMRLGAVYTGGIPEMWPIKRTYSSDTDNSFKWYITTYFRINDDQKPVIDAIFTNVEHRNQKLASNAEGNLRTVIRINGDHPYIQWTAELVTTNGTLARDVGVFQFRNKNTKKFLSVSAPHKSKYRNAIIADINTKGSKAANFTIQ